MNKKSRDYTKLNPLETEQVKETLNRVILLFKNNDIDVETLQPVIKNLKPETLTTTFDAIKEFCSSKGKEAVPVLSALLKEPFLKEPHSPWSKQRIDAIAALSESARNLKDSQQSSLYLRNLLRGKGSKGIKYSQLLRRLASYLKWLGVMGRESLRDSYPSMLHRCHQNMVRRTSLVYPPGNHRNVVILLRGILPSPVVYKPSVPIRIVGLPLLH